jgi:hypothetical protein
MTIDKVPESIGHLIAPYIAQTKRDAHALVTLLSEQRFEEIRTIAHDLKGSGSTYGFPELTELGRQLTIAADGEDRATAEGVIAQLNTFTRSAAVLMHAQLEGIEMGDSSRWLASKILVIDDSPTILKMAAAMLRMDGHQVHIQSNAEQGLLSLHFIQIA